MNQDVAEANSTQPPSKGLSRELGLLCLAATGICSMLGAAINVIPFTIQRNVPGIGPYVLPAYLFAALPALLAAMSYAMLSSAMPRAGGSYIYASRGLNPYLGFVASFSQWFGLSIAIGVVSYVTVPFLRDIAIALDWQASAAMLEWDAVKLILPMLFLWTFVGINLKGARIYERTLVPLMFLMFILGSVVIFAGFWFDQKEFAAAVMERTGQSIAVATEAPFTWRSFLMAAALLFASFIGFDSIAQAGGEARNPRRNLPLAIIISIVSVGTFYFLFTAAVYHTVPWTFMADEASSRDLTAPGLLGYVLPGGLTVLIVGGAAVALINDLPAMLLAVSRLMFAWAEDGVFPSQVAKIHPTSRTPHVAILLCGTMASIGILGSHLAGDFFLGVDILVTSMMVNFLLICLTVLSLPRVNPGLAKQVSVVSSRRIQVVLATLGAGVLGCFLIIHIWKDLTSPADAWYFRSTPVWIAVMLLASGVYARELRRLRKSGINIRAVFSKLPPE